MPVPESQLAAHEPDMAQLQVLSQVTLLGINSQISPERLLATLQTPEFTTRPLRLVPEICMADVVEVVQSEMVEPL